MSEVGYKYGYKYVLEIPVTNAGSRASRGLETDGYNFPNPVDFAVTIGTTRGLANG